MKKRIQITSRDSFHINDSAWLYWYPSGVELVVWATGRDNQRVSSITRIPMRVLAACVNKARRAKRRSKKP